MAERHQGLVWTQRTGPAPPGARPTHVEETNSYSSWPQRAISLRDIMNHKSTNNRRMNHLLLLISDMTTAYIFHRQQFQTSMMF